MKKYTLIKEILITLLVFNTIMNIIEGIQFECTYQKYVVVDSNNNEHLIYVPKYNKMEYQAFKQNERGK